MVSFLGADCGRGHPIRTLLVGNLQNHFGVSFFKLSLKCAKDSNAKSFVTMQEEINDDNLES